MTRSMHAFVIDEIGAPPVLRSFARPAAGAGDVVVGVRASSVNPTDLKLVSGEHPAGRVLTGPVALGRDFAGTVVEVGPGPTAFAVGDEVFGVIREMKPRTAGFADVVISVGGGGLRARPPALSPEQAAAIALSGLTGLSAVRHVGAVGGDIVLLRGATGGIGCLVLQLLAGAGVSVAATGRDADRAMLTEMGACWVLPRDTTPAELRASFPGGVDAVIDLVGDRDLAGTVAAVRDGGRASVVLRDARPDGPRGIAVADARASLVDDDLSALADLVVTGRLRPVLDRVISFEELANVLPELGARRIRGKVIVRH